MNNKTKHSLMECETGPRELKDPRSVGYAKQTLLALKRYAEMLRCDEARIAKELEVIDKYKHWEILGYPSKEAMLAAELNATGQENVAKVKRTVADVRVAGDPKGGRPKKGSQCLPLPKGSNTKDRLAARIKRDHPDIVKRIEAGEFKSVRAAGIAAGIVKVKTPYEQLQHWWKKADETQRCVFRLWIDGELEPQE